MDRCSFEFFLSARQPVAQISANGGRRPAASDLATAAAVKRETNISPTMEISVRANAIRRGEAARHLFFFFFMVGGEAKHDLVACRKSADWRAAAPFSIGLQAGIKGVVCPVSCQ